MSAAEGSGCAWITGASSGLGRALALRMARDGWQVVASARRAEALSDLVREADGLKGDLQALPLDVTDQPAVAAAVRRIETEIAPVRLAVLNAGSHQEVRASSFDGKVFRSLIELNVMGTVNCLEAMLPPMIGRHRGRIAVVASLAGYHGLPTASAYGLTKAGLINMAEALKPELDGFGVQMQIVNPGFVRTPLTDVNPFPMPFLMELEDAAEAFYRGLQSNRFEIVFPWRFAALLKVLRYLPARLAFALTRRMVPAP